jgi:hypothetical protein
LIGLALTVDANSFSGQMLPYHKAESREGKGCELHLEENCFAFICNGFVKIGLNTNLDFTTITEDSEDKQMIIDENEVLLFGTYRNSVLEILKIPFFNQGSDNE